MNAFSNDNLDVKYLLTIIDVFSKYAWIMLQKTKTGKAITEAFAFIVSGSRRKPTKLWLDEGAEFYNRRFKKYLGENGVEM